MGNGSKFISHSVHLHITPKMHFQECTVVVQGMMILEILDKPLSMQYEHKITFV